MPTSIEVSGPMLESEIPAYLESSGFNAACDAYEKHYWHEFTKDLSQEDLEQVLQWWERRMPPGYWDTRSEAAYSAVMRLISVGLG